MEFVAGQNGRNYEKPLSRFRFVPYDHYVNKIQFFLDHTEFCKGAITHENGKDVHGSTSIPITVFKA